MGANFRLGLKTIPLPASTAKHMLACFGRGEQHVIEENFSHGLAYFTKLYIPFFS